jgi:hypothetical protein
MSASVYGEWKAWLRKRAYSLIWQVAPAGPPYDPFLVAKHMQVNVSVEAISGIDGFVEVRNGGYFAVISSLTSRRRQRFTLSHELGHVLFMRISEEGNVVPLIRYRNAVCPPRLHQDPLEEALCNSFASELLLPTSEVENQVLGSRDPLDSVLELSKSFDVSLQAAAKRVVGILGKGRIGCALWKNSEGNIWPMPVWSEGVNTDCRNQLLQIEGLVTRSADSKSTTECIFDCFGKSRIKAEILVRPLGKNYSFVLAVATDKKRKSWSNKDVQETKSQAGSDQLSLFS